MPRSTLCSPIPTRALVGPLAGLITACLLNGGALAATLPTAPKTFDSSYVAPTGAN